MYTSNKCTSLCVQSEEQKVSFLIHLLDGPFSTISTIMILIFKEFGLTSYTRKIGKKMYVINKKHE